MKKLSLLIISIAAALVIALMHHVTKEPIQNRAEQTSREARQLVLPGASEFTEVDSAQWMDNPVFGDIGEAYYCEGAGYSVKVYSKGYGGNIEIMVGVDTNGTVTGVKIGDNNETPGLGSNAADSAFTDQFNGISPDNPITVKKSGADSLGDIQALTGATVTSAAVANGVDKARELVKYLLEM